MLLVHMSYSLLALLVHSSYSLLVRILSCSLPALRASPSLRPGLGLLPPLVVDVHRCRRALSTCSEQHLRDALVPGTVHCAFRSSDV